MESGLDFVGGVLDRIWGSYTVYGVRCIRQITKCFSETTRTAFRSDVLESQNQIRYLGCDCSRFLANSYKVSDEFVDLRQSPRG